MNVATKLLLDKINIAYMDEGQYIRFMAGQSVTRLYVDMQPKSKEDENSLPKLVLESYWENRRLHDSSDNEKERSIKFVHQEHWDPDVEAQRTAIGLPSMVADKTLSVWKTLDGYARKNKVDIKFTSVGSDDYGQKELHNKIHSFIKNTKELHHYQSEAYGLSAICDEAFFLMEPVLNSLGELDPDFSVMDPFECYPDANFKDPIEMRDAEFIDLPFWINPQKVPREFRGHMGRIFEERLEDYSPSQTFNDERPRNTNKNRDGQTIVSSNGLLLGIKRMYKKYHLEQYIVDDKGNVIEKYDRIAKQTITKKAIRNMGYDVLEIDREELWNCVIIPEITEDHFVYNEPADFQPINPTRLGHVRWNVTRTVFTHVAGKAVGAIRGITKINEMRNLILSALMHHLQTASNGGLLRERNAFGGDENEEHKFDTQRNRAGYTGIVADGALKEQRIGQVPRAETAFGDGGAFLEGVMVDIIKDVSGAEPIMKGQAQKGSPASLFQLQVEQSQNQLMSSTEYFKFFQHVVADNLYAFTRQFWNVDRILNIEGGMGAQDERIQLMQQQGEKFLNDPAQGLYTVYKGSGPVTESARRMKLNDNIEVARGLAELGLPLFAQDVGNIVDSIDMPSEVKASMMSKVQQWQKTQGILSEQELRLKEAQIKQANAGAQSAQMANQPQAPQGVPA